MMSYFFYNFFYIIRKITIRKISYKTSLKNLKMENTTNEINKSIVTNLEIPKTQTTTTQEPISLTINEKLNEIINENNTDPTKPPFNTNNSNNEIPGTTLLLNNNTKSSNKSIYKILVYIIFAVFFGYFISKTDNNKYKIGLITGFVILSTFVFNKFLKEPSESHTVIDDNGTNLIEG